MLQKPTRFLSVLLFFICLSLSAGCQSDTHPEAGQDHPPHASGDIRETTGRSQLPSFLGDFPAEVTRIYQEVPEHSGLLTQMPCYCGCGQSVGHKNNLDCFIHQQSKGEITWDSHATTCGVCLMIADESIQMKKSGKKDKEIREAIDQKYANGYAEPTPTPAL